MTTNVLVPPSNGGGLPGDRVIRGTVARWSATTGWVDRDGLPLPDTMLVIGYTTVLRRWKDKKPEYITEHPLPDPKQLNAAIPVEEWEIGLDGNPTPPWKLTYVIYMVDAGKTGGLFTYAHDTYGAMLCFNNLEEAIGVVRLLRGEHVYPIVRLDKRQWKSRKYGMQTRPHLDPIEWRTPGGGGPKLAPQSPTPQLTGPATAPTPAPTPAPAPTAPAPTAAPTPAPAPATPQASTILDNTKPVKPVTVAELIADEIPWK
jgi:hypothetical protein